MSEKHYKPQQIDPGPRSDFKAWVVEGPYIGGGTMGTVPKHSVTMTRDDADTLADLLERAYAAGRDNAQRSMRNALGMKD